MEVHVDSGTPSSTATPSPRHVTVVDAFRTELEALDAEQTVHYFGSQASEKFLREIGRSGDVCKKLLGAHQIKAESHITDVLSSLFWSHFPSTETESQWGNVNEALQAYSEGVNVFVTFFERALDRLSLASRAHADYEYSRVKDIKHCAQLRLLEHQHPSIQELIGHAYVEIFTEALAFNTGESHERADFGCVQQTQAALQSLGLQDIQEMALRTVVLSNVKHHLDVLLGKCSGKGNWAAVIKGLGEYSKKIAVPFLQHVVPVESIPRWKELVDACARGALGQKRTEQLFEIVADYPESRSAICDIKASLELGPFVRTDLTRKFCAQVQGRLLQAGTATRAIVDHFLKAARMFYEIDPDGEMMKTVGQLYRDYLQGRGDTMRHIVAVLADTKQEAPCILEELADTDVDDNSEEDENPDSAALKEITKLMSAEKQLKEKRRRRVAVHDIVSTLESICSHQEGFVEECQKLLAEQLSAKSDFQCDRECRVIELLKKRYGETALRKCEIMLNDVTQSKIINKRLQEETSDILNGERMVPDAPVISSTLISYLFWPALKEPDVYLPPEIQRAMHVYGERYSLWKAPRKLTWMTGSGVVDLDVKVAGTTRSFRVAPILATIITKFSAAKSFSESNLAAEIGVDVSVLRTKIAFWLNNGVLHESNELGEIWYHRCETMDGQSVPIMEESDEELPDQEPEDVAQTSKADCYKTYIVGFLAHHPNGAALDDIHQHLERFVKQHTFDMTQAQLADYLSVLTTEGVIEMTSTGFKAKK